MTGRRPKPRCPQGVRPMMHTPSSARAVLPVGLTFLAFSCESPSVSEGLVSCNAELGSALLARCGPFEIQSLLCCCALAQIQVDQRLIGDGCALGQTFEVADRLLIEANRNLLLQTLRVWVRSSLGEVV